MESAVCRSWFGSSRGVFYRLFLTCRCFTKQHSWGLFHTGALWSASSCWWRRVWFLQNQGLKHYICNPGPPRTRSVTLFHAGERYKWWAAAECRYDVLALFCRERIKPMDFLLHCVSHDELVSNEGSLLDCKCSFANIVIVQIQLK